MDMIWYSGENNGLKNNKRMDRSRVYLKSAKLQAFTKIGERNSYVCIYKFTFSQIATSCCW